MSEKKELIKKYIYWKKSKTIKIKIELTEIRKLVMKSIREDLKQWEQNVILDTLNANPLTKSKQLKPDSYWIHKI